MSLRRKLVITTSILGVGALAFAGIASAAGSGGGANWPGQDAGKNKGGIPPSGATPEQAGKSVSETQLDENSREFLEKGPQPGVLYLAGNNFFFRGLGLILAKLNNVAPIPVQMGALTTFFDWDMTQREQPALVLVAIPPKWQRGTAYFREILYSDQDSAKVSNERWYQRAIEVAKKGLPGEA